MLYKFYEIFDTSDFDKHIINLTRKCISFINRSSVEILDKKKDGSPLSVADLKINKIIKKELTLLSPSVPILSEEKKFLTSKYLEKIYWLIDPIDGTKSYICGGNEFTVNIALIKNGKPIMGLIAHPPSKNIWYAKKKKLTIIRKNIECKEEKKSSFPVIITSKEKNQKLKQFLSKIGNHKRLLMSSSLKFCLIAENKADIYPRFTSINKWDIAAGHAIIKASGGQLINQKGQTINYQSNTSQTGKFITISKKSSIKKSFFLKIFNSK